MGTQAEKTSKPRFRLTPWLIGFWNKPFRRPIGWILFVLSYTYLFPSLRLGLVILVSMVLHEAGHGLNMKLWQKANFTIVPVFPFAAAALPTNPEQKAIADTAHWMAQAMFTLAGPLVNGALMLLGLGLKASNHATLHALGGDLALVNSVMGVTSLLPLGKLDGGQFVHIVYSSLREKMDKTLLLGVTRAAFVAGGITVGLTIADVLLDEGIWVIIHLVQSGIFLVVVAAMVAGFTMKHDDDKPEHSNSPQAMSTNQALSLVIAYMLVLFAQLAVMVNPF